MADLDTSDMQETIERLREQFEDLMFASKQQTSAAKNVFKDLTIEDALRKQLSKQLKEEHENERKRARGKDQLAKTAQNLAGGMFSTTSAVYGATDAFSAVTPVIDLMASTAKNVVEALSLMASGVSVLGFSTGRVSEGIAKAVSTGIDLVSTAVNQQLKNTQMVVNNLNAISKVGVTFGGSISLMQDAARRGGISIDTYSKMVSKNADILAGLGGSVQLGADRVVTMGRNIANSNRQLLAMYGNFENLNEGIADFISIQTGYGLTGVKTNKDLEKSAKDYLYRQKELADLTGQSADALKKAERQRQTVVAYQNAQAMMTADELANSQIAIELARKRGGDKLAQAVMEEIIARKTGMRVYSEDTMLLHAQQPEIRGTFNTMLDSLSQSQQSFKSHAVATIKASADEVEARNRSAHLTTLSQLYMTNHLKDSYSSVAAATGTMLLSSNEWARNLTEGTILQEKNRKQGEKDAGTVAGAIDSLEQFKVKMDDITIKNLGNTATYLELAYTAAEHLATGLEHTNDAVNMLTKIITGNFSEADFKSFLKRIGIDREESNRTAGQDFAYQKPGTGSKENQQMAADIAKNTDVEALRKLVIKNNMDAGLSKDRAEELAKLAYPTTQPPAKPPKAEEKEEPKEKMALGGVANKPVIAGEAGPEAIVPLPNGRSIPVEMDMSQLVEALRDLLDVNKDNRDYLERIFHASM